MQPKSRYFFALTIGRRPSATPAEHQLATRRSSSLTPQIGTGWAPLSRGQIGLRCGLYLLFNVLVELPQLNRLQFTTTAFLAAQAGIFLWLLAWQRRTMKGDAAVVWPLSAAVCLLFVGGIIRWESLALAVLVAVPLIMLFPHESWRSAILPCGIAVAVAGALVVTALAYDRWTYEQDPIWRRFRQLNQIRGKFHDSRWTSYTPETAHVFSQVGWSENDHAMMANWFSDDPVLYSEANLVKIVEAYPWSSARLTTGIWWQAFRSIAQNRTVLSVLLVLPFVLSKVQKRRAKLTIMASALAALALIILVVWSQKVPPERVYLPLLSFPLSVALLSFAWCSGAPSLMHRRDSHDGDRWSGSVPVAWRGRRLRIPVVVGLLIVAVAIGVDRQFWQSVRVHRGRIALQSFLNEARTGDRKLYISWEAACPTSWFLRWIT